MMEDQMRAVLRAVSPAADDLVQRNLSQVRNIKLNIRRYEVHRDDRIEDRYMATLDLTVRLEL